MSELHHIQWNAHLTTQVSTLDDQHQDLIEMVNDIVDNLAQSTREETSRRLDLFAQATKAHFDKEEAVMRQISHPNYEAHRNLHATMIREFEDFRRLFWRRTSQERLDGLYGFLKYWLLHHMETDDVEIRRFITRNGLPHPT